MTDQTRIQATATLAAPAPVGAATAADGGEKKRRSLRPLLTLKPLLFKYKSVIFVAGAAMVVSANIGCLTQLGVALAAAGHTVQTAHAVELLAMALPGRRGPQ